MKLLKFSLFQTTMFCVIFTVVSVLNSFFKFYLIIEVFFRKVLNDILRLFSEKVYDILIFYCFDVSFY
jgi:hypothetical protein